MTVAAVLVARDAAPWIAALVATVRAAGVVDQVVVVDAGSRDTTAAAAGAAGADRVVRPPPGSRDRAARAGVAASTGDVVVLLDAHGAGLRPGHVVRLVEPVAQGRCAMTCGLYDYGAVVAQLVRVVPRLTGERAVRRDLLAALPERAWVGRRLEAYLNAAAAGHSCDVLLEGVEYVPPWQRTGASPDWRGAVLATRDALVALAEVGR